MLLSLSHSQYGDLSTKPIKSRLHVLRGYCRALGASWAEDGAICDLVAVMLAKDICVTDVLFSLLFLFPHPQTSGTFLARLFQSSHVVDSQ